jgi:hypothetical protein
VVMWMPSAVSALAGCLVGLGWVAELLVAGSLAAGTMTRASATSTLSRWPKVRSAGRGGKSWLGCAARTGDVGAQGRQR